jgi:hypothetical protein
LENPYKPPKAYVADAADVARGPRPSAVTRAVIAFWIGWVLGLLTLIPGVRENVWDNPEIPAGAIFPIATVFEAFSAWLIVMVGRGRNWARWTWVALVALTYLLMAADPSGWEKQGPVALGVDFATALLELYGCYLILTGPGAAWFTRGARAAREPMR